MRARGLDPELVRLSGTDQAQLVRLRAVTVSADAPTLRLLASFLLHAAERLEQHGNGFGHEHFEDFCDLAQGGPQFVVTGPGPSRSEESAKARKKPG